MLMLMRLQTLSPFADVLRKWPDKGSGSGAAGLFFLVLNLKLCKYLNFRETILDIIVL